MGKVTKQKARKEWRCGKCGAIIKRGEEYYILRVNYHPVKRRCIKCGFKGWELSSSYFVRTIGALIDSIRELGEDHNLTDLELQNIQEALCDLKNQLEEGIDNMPENLADSSPVLERQDEVDCIEDMLDAFPEADEEVTIQDMIELLENLQNSR